ncbi:MAG: DNA-3-methyladenine glycosylase [FCB group bacterium]|nr:DNA-3-methyladenine glycosylase [FCB group bacterium]
MEILGQKLTRDFYLRPTLTVAPDLLGKTIVYNHPQRQLAADIVEVEAYVGEDDPACHAASGKTERNRVMYGRGGYSYLYFIYGMYHCFNIVTERDGFPAAVLIRGVEPFIGKDIMSRLLPPGKSPNWLISDGPGKFCRAFGLTRKQNGLDLTGSELFLIDRGNEKPHVGVSPRVGIKKATKREWRFFDINSRYVSGNRTV